MNSRIEQIIEEIEKYIASCKPAGMFRNGTDIIVNKDEIDELLEELKSRTPEEIRRYQKIISNKEAILADAQQKADSIVAEARRQNSELISEHQIMQQAYAQANEVVMVATKQAQEILDKATMDANSIRESAISYTDERLQEVQEVLVKSIDGQKSRGEALINLLQGQLDVVVNNRMSLRPEAPVEEPEEQPVLKAAPKEEAAASAPAEKPKEKGKLIPAVQE